MPRYYFNIRNGAEFQDDPEGSEFASVDLACDEAINAAREIMSDNVLKGEVLNGQIFEITTESGDVVGKVPFKSALRLG